MQMETEMQMEVEVEMWRCWDEMREEEIACSNRKAFE
jgi:hypothetical protein